MIMATMIPSQVFFSPATALKVPGAPLRLNLPMKCSPIITGMMTRNIIIRYATTKAPPLAAATRGNLQILPVPTEPAISDITNASCEEYPSLLLPLSDIFSSFSSHNTFCNLF